jgi:hypothetical protein
MERPVWDHDQFKVSKKLGLGPSGLEGIALRTSNLASDPSFEDTVSGIESELEG